MPRGRTAAAFVIGAIGLFGPIAGVACGSRTGLLVDESVAPPAIVDAGRDARRDARPLVDSNEPDTALPELDARPRFDARPLACIDAGDTQIYAVSSNTDLLAFYPPTATFTLIGKLVCPDPSAPFSMAVDRKGIAFVLYSTGGTDRGRLYRVSTATAACTPTAYQSGQLGYASFGMGFAADDIGGGETLYIANDDTSGGSLGALDTTSFLIRDIGQFQPAVYSGELTGTGDGRLYTFYTKNPVHQQGIGSIVAEVDKTNGKILGEHQLATVDQGTAWAFAFWGGDFYLFTSQGGPSTVTRYRPSDGSVTAVATYPTPITGAGVSTCAPSQ
jgi:hypothetical protein